MKKRKTIWKLWAKALGEKASKSDRESDTIAWIRTFIFISYLVTNCFIMAGVIRHWNDNDKFRNTLQTCRDYSGYVASTLQI